jgi:hypothetical protein
LLTALLSFLSLLLFVLVVFLCFIVSSLASARVGTLHVLHFFKTKEGAERTPLCLFNSSGQLLLLFFLPVDYRDAIAAACFPFFLFEKYRVSVEDSAAIVALRGHFGFTHSPFFSAFLQFVFSAHLLCSATRLHESDEVFFCSDFYLPAAQATETCEEQTFEIASTRNITSHRVAFSSEHTQYWVAARHRGGFSTTLERHLFTWGRSLPLPSFPFFHRCS